MAEFDEEGNLVRRETTPRRYTYVLGPNESCRTATERFMHLSEKGLSATMEDVIEAFSVEKLNKEFFADFAVAFDRVKSEIQKRNRWENERPRRKLRPCSTACSFCISSNAKAGSTASGLPAP